MAQQQQPQQAQPDGEDEIDELVSRLGEGLTIAQVAELRAPRAPSTVTALNLHGNAIARIEGLAHLSRLTRLNLSSNAIAAAEGLSGLASLTSLNLASNRLRDARGLRGLTALEDLNLSYNAITSLDALADPAGPAARLRLLSVQHNALAGLAALAPLAGCLQLTSLRAGGNPATLSPAAYAALRQALPQVRALDDAEAVSAEAGWHLARAQLAAADGGGWGAPAGAAPPAQWQQAGPAPRGSRGSPHRRPRQSPSQPRGRAAPGSGDGGAGALQLPPWLEAAARPGGGTSDDEAYAVAGGSYGAEGPGGGGPSRRQALQAAARLAKARRAAGGRAGAGGEVPGGYSDQSGSDDSGGGSDGAGSRDDGAGGAGSDQGGRRPSPAQRRGQQGPPARRKTRSSSTNTGGAMLGVRRANAAAQTADSGPVVERLQAEAERLRRELGRVAGGRGLGARGRTPCSCWASSS